MFNNEVLDVFIGLVFVYLLYSLLATVVGEIIATMIGLRARNVREAVDRMLNDEDEENKSMWVRIWDSINILKKPKSRMVTNFYNHPEIKYLGSTGIFRNPSSFKAISFSKTLLYILNGSDEAFNRNNIEERLKKLKESPEALNKDEIILDKETAVYVLSLWNESYGDITKFKLLLETWFDRTMEQASEWYKRKIQTILLILGFFMAWFGGADTFLIAKNLSTDKDARTKIVEMASAYVQNNPRPIELSIQGTNDTVLKKLDSLNSRKLDSLLDIKKQLEKDIAEASSVIGIGGWLPDTIRYATDKDGRGYYIPYADQRILDKMGKEIPANGKISFDTGEKLRYFFALFPLHFLGFLITAIAISLGAPFWYDLLNKLMKLRTSVKQSTDSPNNSADMENAGSVSRLNRVG